MNIWLAKLIVFVAFTAFSVRADNLVKPDPLIGPAEVVAIQMTSLKHNDLDEPDFGIRQTWAFAHPQNRRLTGPLPRFAMMLNFFMNLSAFGPNTALILSWFSRL